jgi:hypothetical protein
VKLSRWLWIATALALLIWYGVDKRLAYSRNHGCWYQPDPPCLQSHLETRTQLTCDGGQCLPQVSTEFVCDQYGPLPPKQPSSF